VKQRDRETEEDGAWGDSRKRSVEADVEDVIYTGNAQGAGEEAIWRRDEANMLYLGEEAGVG